VPRLAQREVLVRFPKAITYRDRQGQTQPVEWVAADLGRLQRYAPAFNEDGKMLKSAIERLEEMGASYGIQELRDGVVILQRGASDRPGTREALAKLLQRSIKDPQRGG
jgi:hypothetical protein